MRHFLASILSDDAGNLRRRVVGLYALLIAANLAAWAWALVALQDYPVLLGTAVLAYTFGLRHAVDADHIAAIDNVTRALMQTGKRPIAAGLFFSLGHSVGIFAMTLIIAVAAKAVETRFTAYKAIGEVLGTSVSAFFLFAIAIVNAVIFVSVYRAFRSVRAGAPFIEEDMNTLLSGRGLLARLFRPLFRIVSRSWHLLPIGLLFGLGFDTVTEVGLFGISATQAADGKALSVVLVFPVLFGAAMALVDTTDSLHQADPEALLQHDHHAGVGTGRHRDRRHRGARADRGSARPAGRLLGSDRRSQRQLGRARLRHHRRLRGELAGLARDLSPEALRRDRRQSGGQRPLNCALRFSMKARRPSM
jgi:high-affinity nickel-transport protein